MAKHRNPAYTESSVKKQFAWPVFLAEQPSPLLRSWASVPSKSGTGSASSHVYLINSLTL